MSVADIICTMYYTLVNLVEVVNMTAIEPTCTFGKDWLGQTTYNAWLSIGKLHFLQRDVVGEDLLLITYGQFLHFLGIERHYTYFVGFLVIY